MSFLPQWLKHTSWNVSSPLPSLLRGRSSRWFATPPSSSPPSRPPSRSPASSSSPASPAANTTAMPNFALVRKWIGDTSFDTVQGYDSLDRKIQPHFYQTPVYDNEEDSPSYFHYKNNKVGLISRTDLSRAGKVQWPLIPEVDARTLTNQQWAAPERQEMNLGYCNKHGVIPELFPGLDFSVNLNVRYSDMYWHSVFFGNIIPTETTVQAPKLRIASDPVEGLPPDPLFTLLMFCPDYPFRTRPDDGHLLHWMICNVPMRSEEISADSYDTVVDYMPPLPTEYAGHFRHVFVLYPQKGRIAVKKSSQTGMDVQVPFSTRRNFFLHKPLSNEADGKLPLLGENLRAVVEGLERNSPDRRVPVPVALTFFHSVYDVQVSEFYQAHRLQEPLYVPRDVLEDLLLWRKYKASKELREFSAHFTPSQWASLFPPSQQRQQQRQQQQQEEEQQHRGGGPGQPPKALQQEKTNK